MDGNNRNTFVNPFANPAWFIKAFGFAEKLFKFVSWALTIVAVQVVARKTNSLLLGMFGLMLQMVWIFVVQIGVYPIVNSLTKHVFAEHDTAAKVDFAIASLVAVGLGIIVVWTIPALVTAALP